jgi:hypothetical protein
LRRDSGGLAGVVESAISLAAIINFEFFKNACRLRVFDGDFPNCFVVKFLHM